MINEQLDNDLTRHLGKMLAECVEQIAGETLLRKALSSLIHTRECMKRREGFVYMALMGAVSAGYPCGVKAGSSSTYETDTEALIRLPQGWVRIEMPQYGEKFPASIDDRSETTIREYLGSGEVEDES